MSLNEGMWEMFFLVKLYSIQYLANVSAFMPRGRQNPIAQNGMDIARIRTSKSVGSKPRTKFR